MRDQLVRDRTSLMNQVRSLLLERGHIVPQGRARLAVRLQTLLEDEASGLSAPVRSLIEDVRARFRRT